MKKRTFTDFLLEEFEDSVFVTEEHDIEVISTGSLALDVSIGVGGIPRGKITEIYGPEGSGKTTLALSIVKKCLEKGGSALYIDAENMLDYHSLKQMVGREFTPDSLRIVKPETAEDVFKIAEAGMDSGEFSLVIIDSIGALAPSKEKEDNFEDANVALVPRLVSKFLRRNTTGSIMKNNVALVLLNQVRDKIGSYMSSFETPGGHALKHFTSLRIQLSRGQDLEVGKDKVGIITKFVIRKNKMSAPFRSSTIPILFGRGVDTYTDVIDFASLLGVIKRSGSFYKFEDVVLGQGKISSANFLEERQDVLDKIVEKVYNGVSSTISRTLDDQEVEDEE